MDISDDICILCLVRNRANKNISSFDKDRIVIEDKLSYILSELENIEIEVPKTICLYCLHTVNYVYKFKKKCIENLMSLTRKTKFYIIEQSTEEVFQNSKNIEITSENSQIQEYVYVEVDKNQIKLNEQQKEDDAIKINENIPENTEIQQEYVYIEVDKSLTKQNKQQKVAIKTENREGVSQLEPILFVNINDDKFEEFSVKDENIEVKREFIEEEEKPEEDYPKLESATANNTCTPIKKKPKKLHACAHCPKTFVKPSNLISHQSRHNGQKKSPTQHKCGICNKLFMHSNALVKHMQTHVDTQPYKCNLCEKQFQHLYCLKKHILIHADVRQHKCNLCEKSFVQKNNLKVHLKRRHDNAANV